MRAQSAIIVCLVNDKWGRIDCSSGGTLEHTGHILFDHYTSQETVESLIELGDLSILGPEIGYKRASGRREKEWCCALGRDLGQKECEARLGDSLAAIWPKHDTKLVYVWDDDQWFVADPGRGTRDLVNLGDRLMGKTTITALGMLFGQQAALKPRDLMRRTG